MNGSMIRILVSGAIAAAFAGGAYAQQEATGAGASFPAPLYAKWASDYNKATGVRINYQSVGSGAGIRQIDAHRLYILSIQINGKILKSLKVNAMMFSPALK